MIDWPDAEELARRFPEIQGRRRLGLSGVSTPDRPKSGTLLFALAPGANFVGKLAGVNGCLLLLPESAREASGVLEDRHGVIYSSNPRYLFAAILNRYFDLSRYRGKLEWDRDRRIYAGTDVKIAASATLEPGVTVLSRTSIGEGAFLMSGARVGPDVRVGKNAVVGENSVIGGHGFGFGMENGEPSIRIPHFGGVEIGADVEIGALVTVRSGTIDPTVISCGAKIDDHVHIAHNCCIRTGTVIIAHAEISGSVVIGERTWVGPNSTFIDGVTIGAECTVAPGSVVMRSFKDGLSIFGNPARVLPGSASKWEIPDPGANK